MLLAPSRELRPRSTDAAASRWPVGALLVVALGPLLILLLRAPFQDWYPSGDVALIALRTRDVATDHSPLVGPYSNFGWAHPGPLLFEVLAVPYRLFGLRAQGLLIGAVLVNGAAVVTVVLRLLRAGGLRLAAAGTAVLALLVWSFGTSRWWSVWNPDITVLPLVALVVLVWTMQSRSWTDLPLVALFGSFVAQTHIGNVPFVAVVFAVAAWTRVRGRAQPPRTRRRELVATVAVLGLAWAPAVVDVFAHDGGNLRALGRFWWSSGNRAGIGPALRIVSLEFSLHGRLLGGRPPLFLGAVAPRGMPVPVTLFALGAATVVARRLDDRFLVRGCLVMWLLVGAAVVAVANVAGFTSPYLVNFLPALAACAWIVCLGVAIRAIDSWCGASARYLVGLGLVVVTAIPVLIATASAGRAPTGDPGAVRASRGLADMMPSLRHALGPPTRQLEITSTGSFAAGTLESGVVLDLVGHGYDVESADPLLYGHRATDAPLTRSLLVTAGSEEYRRHAFAYTPLARSGPPAPWPARAPRPRPGEPIAAYLQRIHAQVPAPVFRRIEEQIVGVLPSAVFGASPR